MSLHESVKLDRMADDVVYTHVVYLEESAEIQCPI